MFFVLFEEAPETAGCGGGGPPPAHNGGDIAPWHRQKRGGGEEEGTHCMYWELCGDGGCCVLFYPSSSRLLKHHGFDPGPRFNLLTGARRPRDKLGAPGPL